MLGAGLGWRRLEILGFGTYDRRRHPRVGVILEGLAAYGDHIREANRPLALSTADRVAILRRPWLIPRALAGVARCWAGVAGEARRRDRGPRPDAVVVGYLGHLDVLLARALFPARHPPVVLDQLVFGADTARDRGVRSPLALAALGGLDRLACRLADVVVVDTEENAALVPAVHSAKVTVVPVGAPTSWFDAGRRAAAARATGGPGPALKVVFFGLYTPLQGATHLGRALEMLADDGTVEVTMVGTGQDQPAARAAAGPDAPARWLEWVDPDDLPTLVAAHDVCLGIFGTTPKAARVVPNKVYQGAAAGCAVVTSDTAPQRRALGPAAVYVPAGDPEAIASALRALAADRDRLDGLRSAAAEVAARRFTPAAVVGPLRARLAGNR